MAKTFEFLNKYFTKAVFSDVPELDISAVDMGEEMISLTIDGESVKRIATATGTVASAEIFVPVTMTFAILKASPADKIYTDRFKQNGVIPGTCTLYDDVNKKWEFYKMSMSMEGFSLNASEAHRNYVVQGIMNVNTELIAQLG